MNVIDRVRELSGIAVEPSTRIEDLGLDSLELLELFHELNIDRSAIADFENVGQIADHIKTRASN